MTIDYKALAERLSRLADELAAFGHHTSEQRVDDLRAVASLLEGMADMKPAARIYTDAELVHRGPRWGRVCWIVPECEIVGGALLYLHPAPQPQPERQPVSEPTEAHTCLWWRDGDEDSDTWGTSCGIFFTLNEGTPTENKIAFCHHCGKRVEDDAALAAKETK